MDFYELALKRHSAITNRNTSHRSTEPVVLEIRSTDRVLGPTLINFTSQSDDPRFDSIPITPVSVSVLGSISSTVRNLLIPSGSKRAFNLVISDPPTEIVYVTPQGPPGLKFEPSRVVFSVENQVAPILLTVEAGSEAVVDALITFTIESEDARFAGITMETVGVTTTAHILASVESVYVSTGAVAGTRAAEGGLGGVGSSALITLTPSEKPRAAVVVTLEAPGDVTYSPAPVVLTRDGSPQAVTIKGGKAPAETAAITFVVESQDPRFNGILVSPVEVTVQASISVSSTSVTVSRNYNGGVTATLQLSTSIAPIEDILILIRPPGDISLSKDRIVIPAGSTQPLSFEIFGGQTIASPSELTFLVTSQDSRFDNVRIEPVMVTVDDPDKTPPGPPSLELDIDGIYTRRDEVKVTINFNERTTGFTPDTFLFVLDEKSDTYTDIGLATVTELDRNFGMFEAKLRLKGEGTYTFRVLRGFVADMPGNPSLPAQISFIRDLTVPPPLALSCPSGCETTEEGDLDFSDLTLNMALTPKFVAAFDFGGRVKSFEEKDLVLTYLPAGALITDQDWNASGRVVNDSTYPTIQTEFIMRNISTGEYQVEVSGYQLPGLYTLSLRDGAVTNLAGTPVPLSTLRISVVNAPLDEGLNGPGFLPGLVLWQSILVAGGGGLVVLVCMAGSCYCYRKKRGRSQSPPHNTSLNQVLSNGVRKSPVNISMRAPMHNAVTTLLVGKGGGRANMATPRKVDDEKEKNHLKWVLVPSSVHTNVFVLETRFVVHCHHALFGFSPWLFRISGL